MLEALITQLPAIVSALVGGGLFVGVSKLYRTWKKQSRKDEAQDATLREDRVSEQGKRIDDLQSRMQTMETDLKEERKLRLRAQQQNRLLQRKVEILIIAVNDLRKAQGLDAVSEDDIIPSALTGELNGNDSNSKTPSKSDATSE